MLDVISLGEILIDFTELNDKSQGVKVFAQNPGGAPANVAVALSRLGADAAFYGKVGKDMHGAYLKKVLEEEDVDASHLLEDEDFFTTLAFVALNENGERSFSFARKPGADTQLQPEEIDEEFIKDGKILHVGSLSLTDEPSRKATHKAIELAQKNGLLISYDPNYRDSLWPDEQTAIEQMRSLIPFANAMKISDEETRLLTGVEEPVEAAKALIDQGVDVVCVTLGKDGSLVASKEGTRVVPGFDSEVVDTTGAGDSFWAGILYGLSKAGKKPEELSLDELEEIVRLANATAALTVRKLGAIPALPSMEEVQALLNA